MTLASRKQLGKRRGGLGLEIDVELVSSLPEVKKPRQCIVWQDKERASSFRELMLTAKQGHPNTS